MSLSVKNMLGGSGKGLYAWKRRKVTWLYKDGDECTELTGGWSADNYNQTSYTINQGIKNETNMSFIATNDAHTKNLLGTQKLIDPTNYSLFFVELESNEGFEARGTINYDIGYDHDTRRFGFFPKTTTRSFSYADISKLTENLYFSLCETTYGNATVYKVGLISIEEEYITDKSPTKYPNGEVHTDGYFYRYASEGLYVWKKSLFELGDFQNFNKSLSTLPYYFYSGSAVVLNGEIHILGTFYDSVYYKYHYKWNGSSWTRVSTLPYNFHHGSAVVLNGEIHLLGGSDGYTKHYKWDGSSWTSVSTLPYNFSYGSAVVLNGEIHILGGASSTTNHYKWDGSSWTPVSTLPYDFAHGSAVVLNGEIHILGSNKSNNYTKHYKFNGASWTELDSLPYDFYDGSAVVLYGEIHLLGGNGNGTKHYKWDGSSWTSVSTLPYNFYLGSAVVYNSAIQTLGGYSSNASYTKYHYSISGYNPTHTFLDYIVSDKETAYPDGGEKGGYWYEKVSEGITPEMFGCTKMAVDTFTLTSNTAGKNYTISHSLGTIPKYFIIVGDYNIPEVTNGIYSIMGANHSLATDINYANVSYWDISSIATSSALIDSISSVGFKVSNPSFRFVANVKYTVITLA